MEMENSRGQQSKIQENTTQRNIHSLTRKNTSFEDTSYENILHPSKITKSNIKSGKRIHVGSSSESGIIDIPSQNNNLPAAANSGTESLKRSNPYSMQYANIEERQVYRHTDNQYDETFNDMMSTSSLSGPGYQNFHQNHSFISGINQTQGLKVHTAGSLTNTSGLTGVINPNLNSASGDQRPSDLGTYDRKTDNMRAHTVGGYEDQFNENPSLNYGNNNSRLVSCSSHNNGQNYVASYYSRPSNGMHMTEGVDRDPSTGCNPMNNNIHNRMGDVGNFDQSMSSFSVENRDVLFNKNITDKNSIPAAALAMAASGNTMTSNSNVQSNGEKISLSNKNSQYLSDTNNAMEHEERNQTNNEDKGNGGSKFWLPKFITLPWNSSSATTNNASQEYSNIISNRSGNSSDETQNNYAKDSSITSDNTGSVPLSSSTSSFSKSDDSTQNNMELNSDSKGNSSDTLEENHMKASSDYVHIHSHTFDQIPVQKPLPEPHYNRPPPSSGARAIGGSNGDRDRISGHRPFEGYLQMIKDQEKNNEYIPDLYYMEVRRKIVGWMANIGEKLRIRFTTIHVAINYLDRIFTRKIPSQEKWRILAICCLQIATKYEEAEENVPSLQSFKTFDDVKFLTVPIVQKYEIEALESLEWSLTTIVPMHFIEYYLECGLLFYGDHVRDKFIPPNESLAPSCLMRFCLFFSHFCTIRDYTYRRYSPNYVAAVIVYTTRFILNIKPQTWRSELIELTKFDEAAIEPGFQYLYNQFKEDFPRSLAHIEESILPDPPNFTLIAANKREQAPRSTTSYTGNMSSSSRNMSMDLSDTASQSYRPNMTKQNMGANGK